jgi:formate dehydrogenase subunit gamma
MRTLRRYNDRTRLSHWGVAILFFCAALSGLALFHPVLFPLSTLFGGGVWDRRLHPFFGVAMVLCFVPVFVAVRRDNRWTRNDNQWLRHAGTMLRGDEAGMPPVGRYNAGQKLVFWISALSLLVLLLTGFFFWQPWFADAWPIPLRRAMVVLHAAAAVVLVLAIIVHIYSAIWVKGSMRAMTRGTVSEAWARRHHPLWHREITGGPR